MGRERFVFTYTLPVTSITRLPLDGNNRSKNATSNKVKNEYDNMSKLTGSSLQEALERGSYKGKEISWSIKEFNSLWTCQPLERYRPVSANVAVISVNKYVF